MWSSFGPSSPEARHAARRVLADQVAVSLRGEAPPRTSLEPAAPPMATRWSNQMKVHAPAAVLANRLAADASELTAGPELGAAALAAAEIADARLGELLEAVTFGCETESRVRAELQAPVEEAGLHPPALFSAIGAASACARLLGLDETRAWNAVTSAIALAPRSPYAAFSEGVSGKYLYGAWGQKLGLEAALWARQGIAGPDSVIEGRRGVARAFGIERGLEKVVLRARDTDWAILAVTHKRFGCSRACHPTLAALESLGRLDAAKVERVAVVTYPFAVALQRSVDEAGGPASSIAAQMSVRHAAALWIADGVLDWRRFDARGVRRLAERTTVRSNEATDVPGARERRSEVTVTFDDGAVRRASGDGTWRATDEELASRFEGLALPLALWRADEDDRVNRLLTESARG